MLFSVIICLLTCILMLVGVLKFPRISLWLVRVDSYWFITLIGASLLLLTGQGDISYIWDALTADTAINPLKILTLFISMTMLSIFLDEMGFFRFLAGWVLGRAKTSQTKLFIYLYVIVSVLTVFTSNDVIILSFTPFICYFAKNAKIDPIPYLAAEFVAANTWSMALIIGNPTNIYLASSYGVGFAEYTGVMILPTIAAGVCAFFALFAMFHRRLSSPMDAHPAEFEISDRVGLVLGVLFLGVCTVALAVSSYIGLEMYKISLACVCCLFVTVLISCALRKKRPMGLVRSFFRAPWQLVPFVLSMFVMIVVLSQKGATVYISQLLSEKFTVFSYGLSSFLASNIINNIPMSVLFSSVIEHLPQSLQMKAVYATVVGSNLGAFLSPIGALAGIMWSSILSMHGTGFSLRDFLRMGVRVAVPSVICALTVLSLVV